MNLLIELIVSVFAAICIYVNWSFNIWFWSNYSPEKGDSKFKIMLKKLFINILWFISIFGLCFYSYLPYSNLIIELGQNVTPQLMFQYSYYIQKLMIVFEFLNNLIMHPYFIFFFVFFYIFAFLLSLYLFELIYNEIKNESFLELYKVCLKSLKSAVLVSFFLLLYLLFTMNLLSYFIGCCCCVFISSPLFAVIEVIKYELFYSGIKKTNFSKLKECMIIYNNTSFYLVNASRSTFYLIFLYLYRNKFYENNEINFYENKIMHFFKKIIYFLLFIINLFSIIVLIVFFIGIYLLILNDSCFINLIPHGMIAFYIYAYECYLIMNDALSELKYNKSYYFEEE